MLTFVIVLHVVKLGFPKKIDLQSGMKKKEIVIGIKLLMQ